MFLSRVAHSLIKARLPPNSLPTVISSAVQISPTNNQGTLVAYTDGSFCWATRRAGFGVFWGHDHPYNCYGMVTGPRLCNHRAELHAAWMAIELAYQMKASRIIVRTDSEYVMCGIQNLPEVIYKKGYTRYVDLHLRIHYMKQEMINVETEFVKGHSGDYGNRQADKLARMGRKENQPGIRFLNSRIYTPTREFTSGQRPRV